MAETRAISRPPPPPSVRGRMLVCYANVRSLTARYEEVTALNDARRPDIVCLSETWLTDKVLDLAPSFQRLQTAPGRQEQSPGGPALK